MAEKKRTTVSTTGSRRGEARATQDDEGSRLLDKAARFAFLRQQREAGWPGGFAQVALALILAALPLRRVAQKEITRRARLGDGSELLVTFAAVGEGAVMPFGSDVTLLYFLLDRAVREGSPIFEWRYAGEYLRFLGIDNDGGQNFRNLRARWRRLLNLAIRIQRKGGPGDSERGVGLFVIEQYNLPNSIALQDHREQLCIPGVEYGLKLNEAFFREAVAYNVPVPKEIIRETRDDLFLMRLAVFLSWRCYAASTALQHRGRGESVISWVDVPHFTGSSDTNPRRIKADVRRAIMALRLLWPELRAEAREGGLWVAPPAGNLQLFPTAERLRRQP